MLIYIDVNTLEVYGYDNTISYEDAEQYIDDVTRIWFDGEMPDPSTAGEATDGTTVKYFIDESYTTITAKRVNVVTEVVNELTPEELIKQTYHAVEATSYDNLINMDVLLGLDEKLNMIMEHLGLIS